MYLIVLFILNTGLGPATLIFHPLIYGMLLAKRHFFSNFASGNPMGVKSEEYNSLGEAKP